MDADEEQQSKAVASKATIPRPPSALPSVAATVPAAPLGVRPSIGSQLQAVLPLRSEVPSSSSAKAASSTKAASRDASAILEELDAELNGDATLLCSLSRVSLSDFLNSEAAEAVQRVDPQYFSTLSSLLAEDPKTRSSIEDSVAFIVGTDFRHCGFPAFDDAFALLGFYFLVGSVVRRSTEWWFFVDTVVFVLIIREVSALYGTGTGEPRSPFPAELLPVAARDAARAGAGRA